MAICPIAKDRAAEVLAEAIARLSRAELEDLTELLIDRLDMIDGDADLEDDDPAGGNSEDEGEYDYSRGLPWPRYGVDQRRPPLNARRVWERYWFNEHAGFAELRPSLRG